MKVKFVSNSVTEYAIEFLREDMQDLTQIDNKPTGHFIRITDHWFVLNSHSPCVISQITDNHCLVFTVKNFSAF